MKNLAQSIRHNRRRARRKQLLRVLRRDIFTYIDTEQNDKYFRVIAKLKKSSTGKIPKAVYTTFHGYSHVSFSENRITLLKKTEWKSSLYHTDCRRITRADIPMLRAKFGPSAHKL